VKSPLRKSKDQLESALAGKFGSTFGVHEKVFAEMLQSGIPEVDELTEGIPRGAITEICGPISSGRTSLLLSILASATTHGEACSLVDATDSFDPKSAASAGVDLDRVLWVRCSGNLEHAIKATDLLLQGGGFGVVVLDLGDVPPKDARRIPQSYWFRFRRAIEPTKSALLVIAEEPCARSCAFLALRLANVDIEWTGPDRNPEIPTTSYLLAGVRVSVQRIRPVRPTKNEACFDASAVYTANRRAKQSRTKS
jgi:RecA DNA recombination protein